MGSCTSGCVLLAPYHAWTVRTPLPGVARLKDICAPQLIVTVAGIGRVLVRIAGTQEVVARGTTYVVITSLKKREGRTLQQLAPVAPYTAMVGTPVEPGWWRGQPLMLDQSPEILSWD